VYLQSYPKQTFASQEYKAATDQERVEMAEEAVRQAGCDAHSVFGDQVLTERLKKAKRSLPSTPSVVAAH
jgi:hypothetical protein